MSSPLSAPRLAVPTIVAKSSRELLVEHLRQGILSGRYGPQSPLPQERELVIQTGLSRGSVREALRILEAEGLINTRVGRNGGSIVSRPTEELFKRQIYTFMQTHEMKVPQMVEVREALEPKLALLAARNRSDADIATLTASLESMESAAGRNVEAFIMENEAWHLAVAAAARNEMLRLFMEPLAQLVSDVSDPARFKEAALQNEILKAHRGILNAIVAGDGEAAARRMMRHVQAYPDKPA